VDPGHLTCHKQQPGAEVVAVVVAVVGAVVERTQSAGQSNVDHEKENPKFTIELGW